LVQGAIARRVHVAAIREVCGPFYDAAVIDAWSGGKHPSRYVEAMATRAFFVAVVDDDVVGFRRCPASVREDA
jgi:hypothetical protein